MYNITISIDNNLLKKVKKIAVDRDTSFSGLIRAFAEELVEKEERHRILMIDELDYLFKNNSAETGSINWTREDLNDGQKIMDLIIVNPFK